MSYHIYTTDAFVLGSRSRGEADRMFYLYTRDLGAIRAVATGVRLAKSKLAPHLNHYEYIRASVVRGKDIWRVTDACSHEFFVDFDRSSRLMQAKFLAFMKRMVQGEAADVKLFDSLVGAWVYFKQKNVREGQSESSFDKSTFEALLMLRLLRRLGYMKKTLNLEIFLSSLDDGDRQDVYNDVILADFARHKREAVKEINSAIKESHL